MSSTFAPLQVAYDVEKGSGDEPADVAAERTRVSNGQADNDVVVTKNLRKVWSLPRFRFSDNF